MSLRVARNTAITTVVAGAGCATQELVSENSELKEQLQKKNNQIQSINRSKSETESNIRSMNAKLTALKESHNKDMQKKDEELQALKTEISDKSEEIEHLENQNEILNELAEQLEETLEEEAEGIIKLRKNV